jgi:hypothetical protein
MRISPSLPLFHNFQVIDIRPRGSRVVASGAPIQPQNISFCSKCHLKSDPVFKMYSALRNVESEGDVGRGIIKSILPCLDIGRPPRTRASHAYEGMKILSMSCSMRGRLEQRLGLTPFVRMNRIGMAKAFPFEGSTTYICPIVMVTTWLSFGAQRLAKS